MSKIEKILKYIDSVSDYAAKLENRKLKISYQYTLEEHLCMYLTLSHNSLDYCGEVNIYDSNRDCSIFEDNFICSEEDDVIEVLDRLRHFGAIIDENTRKLHREIDMVSKHGYYYR